MVYRQRRQESDVYRKARQVALSCIRNCGKRPGSLHSSKPDYVPYVIENSYTALTNLSPALEVVNVTVYGDLVFMLARFYDGHI
ncbi:MAG TPA: hypothetical protein VH500_15240 [Nitrososphaeraceae archaeon]